MFYAGIDVAKDKHDCIIVDSDGTIVADSFSIKNNMDGFVELKKRLNECSNNLSQIKVGLEATGHYSDNILEFLNSNGVPTILINPLHTNLYRKSLSLRKTKTDRIDALSIVSLIRTENFRPYSKSSYHVSQLKSLTRYRYGLVQRMARQKLSYRRLLEILFPEIETAVYTTHSRALYSLFHEYPGANHIAKAHLTKMTNIISDASKKRYGKEKALQIRELARNSIGTENTIKSLELVHTIETIRMMEKQISEIDRNIIPLVDELNSPILTIPGISYATAAVIIAETSNFENFDSAASIVAYAGLEPSVYQSGRMMSTHAKMVKRGSRYLRFALFNAAKYVAMWEPTFRAYMAKKRAEGKAYNVAVSHTAKKLTRVMFKLVKSNQTYICQQ